VILKDRITTVPGPKHVVIQALLEYHIKLACPSRGVMVQVFREHEIRKSVDGQVCDYRVDVLARYYTNHGKVEMIYEVQNDLDLKSFKKKMSDLGVGGEVIELNRCPDDILLASEWIKDRIVIPDFKRRKSE